MKIPVSIDNLTDKQCRDILMQILEQLEELDMEDFFGTEGWRHYFGFD